MSKYCSDIANKYGIKTGGVRKLIPNIADKVKYVVHYKNLPYYLSLGMKLEKVHRILKFKESNWLKEYVQFSTKKRQESTDELNKYFFELVVNCIYRKRIGNIRKRISLKLINNFNDYLRCVSKPNFVSQKIFDKNFIAVHQIKSVLTLNKPRYVGFSVLELNKLLMYKFHYDYVCNNFNPRLFNPGYPKDSVYYDSSNKKVLGKMKDEFNGIKISEFVESKSKVHSFISVDNKEINKAKGINKKLRHKEYIDVLFNKKVARHNMKRIQSKLYEISTYDIYKISLSCFDDKRYALNDEINTLAYFIKT